jgi:DNA-binding LacI/PurR family transcriptional regulator
MELLGGIFEAAGEYRQNTTIHSSGKDLDGLLDLVSNRSLDALIVHAGDDDPIIPLLGELRIPAVAVADRIERLPSVVVDDAAGGELQAFHLNSVGHRHVITKENPDPVSSAVIRMASFCGTAEKLGMKVSRRTETRDQNFGLGPVDIELLTLGSDRATAVVGWSDHVAQRICDRLDSLGFSVPKDVAVVGFDGTEHACTPRHVLTTIRAPWAKVGGTAVALLNQLIEGDSVSAVTTLPVEFILGATT